jgi:hypothetical protein
MTHVLLFTRRRLLRWSLAAPVAAVVGGTAGATARVAAQDQDATALLQASAQAMSQLNSFAFALTTTRGQSTILENLELRSVTGAVQRPDRFRATIVAGVAFVELSVDVIGIGTTLWVSDPTSREDRFIEITAEGEDAAAQALPFLLDPDRLLLRAVSLIEDPKLDGTEEIGDMLTTRVTGTVDLSKVAQLVNLATPEAAPVSLVLDRKTLTVWIDQTTNWVVRLELAGPLTTSETSDVVRRLELTDFDVPVDIQPPASA